MTSFKTTAAVVGLAVCMATSTLAAPVCLQTILIDHTSVLDSKTILFHMKGGKVWKNTLLNSCPSLHFNGFVMNINGGIDQVCSNQQSISVIRTHETCMMGEFTPYAPAQKS